MALTSVAVGVGIIVAAHAVSRWVLHLNAFRTLAEIGAAHARQQPPTTRPVRLAARIDFFNPATWEPNAFDPAAAERERARIDTVVKQIAFVEISAIVWKWSVAAIGSLVALLGCLSVLRPGWRRRLHWIVGAFVLLAAVLTLTGMRAIIAYGGFPDQPALHYVMVGSIGSAYAWVVLFWLALTRPSPPKPISVAQTPFSP